MKKILLQKTVLFVFISILFKISSTNLRNQEANFKSPLYKIGQYSTPISQTDTRIMTTPEYIHPYPAVKSQMKIAEILGKKETPGNVIRREGMTSHPTTIFTNSQKHIPNSPTFDLEILRKRRSQPKNDVIFHVNENNKLFAQQAKSLPLPENMLRKPPTGPQFLDHKLSTVNKYKMNLLYHGQSKNSATESSISIMKKVEAKIKKIENLGSKEIKELLQTMKKEKNLLEKENEQVYSSINKSENQINLILSSLKDDLVDTQNALNSMIVPVPDSVKPVVFQEITDEYTKSLNGYLVDKTRYPHLKNLDAKELSNLSEKIKNKLNANKNFFLHNGDFFLK